MRPAEISNELIIQTATALEDAGTRVTGFALRKAIGAGTPARMMQVWEAHRSGMSDPASAATNTLPVEIEDALKPAMEQLGATLRQIVSNLHQVSTRITEHRVAEISQKAAHEKDAFEAELKLAADMLDNSEQASAVLRDELAQAREALTVKAAELAQLSERLEHVRAELSEAKESAHGARQQAEDARREAEELRHALEASRQAHAQEQGRCEAALAAEQEQRTQLEKQLGQVRITCDALSEQMNAKTVQLASADAKIKGLNERIVDLGLLGEEQRSSLHNARQSIARLERQNDEMAAELKALRAAQAVPPTTEA